MKQGRVEGRISFAEGNTTNSMNTINAMNPISDTAMFDKSAK